MWTGSEVEVYGAMPEPHKIGQVFLTPATENTDAAGYRQAGTRQMPEPAIRLQSVPAADGYDLAALIPLPMLNVDPAAHKFLLEVAIVTHLPNEDHLTFVNAFHSKSAFMDTSKYGRMSVVE